MIENLNQGRIYKGSIAQVSVPVFPHCFDPEQVSDLVLNFYTEIGGASIEFSGDTITLSGNMATVVFQVPQLEMLADGLLRYTISFSDMVFERETRYYVKTPVPYTPIDLVTREEVEEVVEEKLDEREIVTKDEVGEVVAEKIEEMGVVTEEQVDEKIEEALEDYNPTSNFKTINGETIIGEGNIEIKGSLDFYAPYKFEDYLYSIDYTKLDYEYANEYFEQHAPVVAGGCSVKRYGDKVGRTFDWIFNHNAKFVVFTPNAQGHYAVMGAASHPNLNVADVEAREYGDEYRVLPFYLQDGINERGLFAEINVVPAAGNTQTQPAVVRDRVCATALVRFILDHYATVAEVIADLTENVQIYFPTTLTDMGYECHYFIADENESKVLEISGNTLVAVDSEISTNCRLSGVTFNEDGTVNTNYTAAEGEYPSANGIEVYGSGLERLNILRNTDDMADVYFSQAYTLTDPESVWYSEFVGGTLTVDSPYTEFTSRLAEYRQKWEERSRDTGEVWITRHHSIYDIEKQTLSISVEEQENRYEFAFNEEFVTEEELDEKIAEAVADKVTAEQVDDKIENAIETETARTEETYAKHAEIAEALTGYTPTTGFATINGSAITEGGDIQIQGGGGDSNYLIVDSLDEIENPVEGMEAFVNAQYEQRQGYKVIPHPRQDDPDTPWYDDGMARLDRPDYGGFEFKINTEEGNNRWRADFRDWSETPYGELRYDHWNDLGFYYGVFDDGYLYIIKDNENDIVSVADFGYPRSEIESVEVTIKVAEPKRYIYYNDYGWIEKDMVLTCGMFYPELVDYFFDEEHNAIRHGIYAKYNDKLIKIVSFQIRNSENVYMMGYDEDYDKMIQNIFRFNRDGNFDRSWDRTVHAGGNFVSSDMTGVKGGYYHHYTWDATEDFIPYDENNHRMIGFVFPQQDCLVISSNRCWDRVATFYHGTEDDYDWSWELRRSDNDYENIENNGNWRGAEEWRFAYRRNTDNYNFEFFFKHPEEYTVVLNDSEEIGAQINEEIIDAFPIWLFPYHNDSPRCLRLEVEGMFGYDYGDWCPPVEQTECEYMGRTVKFISRWSDETQILDFYATIPFEIDGTGDTRLWEQAQQGYFTVNYHGYEHFNTIPEKLRRNMEREGDVILFGEEDAQYLIGDALTGYTPTTGFATINGSAITEGGDIQIQGGSDSGLEIVNYADIDNTKAQEIYANPEKYVIKYINGNQTISVYFDKKTHNFAEHSVYFRGPVVKGSNNLFGECYRYWEMFLGNDGGKSISEKSHYYATREYVSSALTGYTPTTGFATINGSAITEGGDIQIQGGSSVLPDAGSPVTPIYTSGGTVVRCNMADRGNFYYGLPYVQSDGQMNVGQYIDFHEESDTDKDFYTRIASKSGYFTKRIHSDYAGGTLPTLVGNEEFVVGSPSIVSIVQMTQSAYDALTTKNPNVLYVIKN